MVSTVSALNTFEQYAHVRLAAAANQAGTYNNGPLNNGVGAQLLYAAGALLIDSVAPEVGDRVLLLAQTNAYENGIYVCLVKVAVGVAALRQRAGDLQWIEQIRGGHYVYVAAGTARSLGICICISRTTTSRFGVHH